MSAASPARRTIFVSYCQDDKMYLDELKRFLKPVESEWSIELWDDSRIKAGDFWEDAIFEVIRGAKLFVLLLSYSFLSSDYITNEELRRILRKAQSEGTKVLPIILGPCMYQSIPEINKRQFANKPEEPYLVQLGRAKRQIRWAAIVEQLRAAIADESSRSNVSSAQEESSGGGQLTDLTTVSSRDEIVLQTKIYRVDKGSSAPYHNIADAVKDAVPGSIIQIGKGEYHESLVIDKPLELRGNGASADDVVLAAHDTDAIAFHCSLGAVSHLTVIHHGASATAIKATQGHLFVSDCNLSSKGYACVAVSGTSVLHLSGSKIFDGKVGVLAYDTAQGWLDDNEIIDNDQAGIEVKGKSAVRLLTNRVHGNKQAGVLFEENGTGLLVDNDIWGNSYSGVEIRGGSPVLRHNTIRDGLSGGILLYGKSSATVEDNDIHSNALAGIAIQYGADPIIRSNRIRDNHTNGVFVSGDGRGQLKGNDITGNQHAGVEIDGGAPVLRKNDIHEGKQSGVRILGQMSSGEFEDNNIFSNAHAGVIVQEGADPEFRKNTIYDNHTHGVFVSEHGRGTFKENVIRGNWEANVQIASGGDPEFFTNDIHGAKRDGIFITDSGRGKLVANTVADNGLSGIAIARKGCPIVRSNTLRNNDYGVYLGSEAEGRFKGNILIMNRRAEVLDESGESKAVIWEE